MSSMARGRRGGSTCGSSVPAPALGQIRRKSLVPSKYQYQIFQTKEGGKNVEGKEMLQKGASKVERNQRTFVVRGDRGQRSGKQAGNTTWSKIPNLAQYLK